LEKTGKKSLRNLYIQMDNASPNKCYTLIAAVGALALLGIVRKTKVSYLRQGHSHTFNDGIIGFVGTHIIQDNMPTFESFETAVKSAFNQKKTGHVEVFRLVGITDYKTMFNDIRLNPEYIDGLTSLHSLRITPREDGTGLDVYYLVDFNEEHNWFPRPAPGLMHSSYHRLFPHPDLNQGPPLGPTSVSAISERGQRHQWLYRVQYVGGAVMDHIVACPSLPFALSRDSVIDRVRLSTRQTMHKKRLTKLPVIRRNIESVLRHRLELDCMSSWNSFFDSLPKSEDVPHSSYINVLEEISVKYGGVIQPRPVGRVQVVKSSMDYFDPITFKGGPVTKEERIAELTRLGYMKKKRGADMVRAPGEDRNAGRGGGRGRGGSGRSGGRGGGRGGGGAAGGSGGNADGDAGAGNGKGGTGGAAASTKSRVRKKGGGRSPYRGSRGKYLYVLIIE
jgi:hypothetical protein